MTEYTVTFKKNYAMEKYLRDAFGQKGNVEVLYGEKDVTLLCKGIKSSDFYYAVAKASVIFGKYNVVKEIYNHDFCGVYPCAFLGALIGQELESEIEKVLNRLPKSQHLNTNGIFLFLMNDLEYTWKTLSLLSKQLFMQCLSDEDFIALTKYFMGGATLSGRTIVLDERMYYDEDGEDVDVVELFDDPSENAAFNVLMKCPSGVVIPFPKNFSKELVKLIRELGE